MYVEGTPKYKDYVDIKNAILMQRNGFVKAEFFFTLPEGRCSFFPIETDIFEVVSLNLSICQLIISYLNSTK